MQTLFYPSSYRYSGLQILPLWISMTTTSLTTVRTAWPSCMSFYEFRRGLMVW